MTDKELAELFAKGTTPDHDLTFVLAVEASIGRIRVHTRLLALAWRAAAMLALTVVMFVTARLLEPELVALAESVSQFFGVPVALVEGIPQFMGVPVPMVLAALFTGLVLYPRFHFPRPRFALRRS